MGLWSVMKESKAETAARLAALANYGVHTVKDGKYKFLPEGKFKSVTKPIEGASAEFESGSDRSRPTLTRIGAGAIIAGPVGAIAGGMFKKNTGKCYVTVVFADGDSVIIEGPVKDETKMRQFASDVTRIGAA